MNRIYPYTYQEETPTPNKPSEIITFWVDEAGNKYIQKLEEENKQLKSILTELEEWTKSEYDRYYNDKENLVFSNVEVIDFGRVLDKIQKLKEKYK